MTYLFEAVKMAALAAAAALVAAFWLSPLASSVIGVGLFYLLLVRAS